MDPTTRPGDAPLRVGISSCLLGAGVRFDGGHKRNAFLADSFGRFVEWVPVCPEVEAGFGTPRESMRLVQGAHGLRLLTVRSGRDVTEQLEAYSTARLEALAAEELSGYVLKKDSPSCGLERVKVYDHNGVPSRTGRGVFARHLLAQQPGLPIEDEGRLSDPRLRENFVERVFAYARLRDLFRGTWGVGALVVFHTTHKMVLMAHSLTGYDRLGRLVARARELSREEVERQYREAFMAALSCTATRRRHTNVLQHMAGHLKTRIDRESRAELSAAIEDYRRELVPLVVPITLLRHHVRACQVGYLAGQVYLDPHPKELMLRNQI
jgi:uncharacterized protein YbgA (DUF1722 family)/uncharacterized protein YbbK (DUF523 family)